MPEAALHERLSASIREGARTNGIALVAYVTAGYPDKAKFVPTLRAIAGASDVIEVGVPFSDPMADGVTIQRASHAAIARGVSLRWILGELKQAGKLQAPVVLMSYLNPLLAFGYGRLAAVAVESHVSGIIVPDLPLEESEELRAPLDAAGLALVHLVTPATPEPRMKALCAASRGFVYAVTVKGTTGGMRGLPAEVSAYLDRVRGLSSLPVCAGFGVRTSEQVRSLSGHADGVVVGSALVEELEMRHDPVTFLKSLRSRRH
jgi:tryptophan synthase alpha chain